MLSITLKCNYVVLKSGKLIQGAPAGLETPLNHLVWQIKVASAKPGTKYIKQHEIFTEETTVHKDLVNNVFQQQLYNAKHSN